MSSRDQILKQIPNRPASTRLEPFLARPAPTDLRGAFGAALSALGAELVEETALASLSGKSAFADEDVPFEFQRGLTLVSDPWEAEVGLTLAELGVAETGSLLLKAGPGRRRLGSLAPPHHVAILDESKLVPDLEAAFGALDERTAVFITGPSRTADIEGVLVRGIHGPGKLWVVLTRLS